MWKGCRCEKYAQAHTQTHTHIHTSTIVGKEFYWFGFYIVYAFCTWQTIAKRRVASQFTKFLLLRLLWVLLLLSNENICKMPITLWVMMGTSFSIQYICYNMDVKYDGLKCLRMWNLLGRWEGWAWYAYVCICVLACLHFSICARDSICESAFMRNKINKFRASIQSTRSKNRFNHHHDDESVISFSLDSLRLVVLLPVFHISLRLRLKFIFNRVLINYLSACNLIKKFVKRAQVD